MRPLARRVESPSSVSGERAHVIRIGAPFFDHVGKNRLDQRFGELGGLSEFEGGPHRGEELPFSRVFRLPLDSRDFRADSIDLCLRRDEDATRAFVDAEHERVVRLKFLPKFEHCPFRFRLRGQHASPRSAGEQLRMRTIPRRGTVNSRPRVGISGLRGSKTEFAGRDGKRRARLCRPPGCHPPSESGRGGLPGGSGPRALRHA